MTRLLRIVTACALVFFTSVSPAARAAGVYRMTGTITPAQAATTVATYYSSAGSFETIINWGGGGGSGTGLKAYLSGLTLSAGVLTPAFSYNTFAYSALVPSATASLTLTPSVPSYYSSGRILVNGQPVASGATSQPVSLAFGVNSIQIEVQQLIYGTTSTYATSTSYAITVTRPAADFPRMEVKQNLSGYSSVSQLPSLIRGTTDYLARVWLGSSSTTVFHIANTGYAELNGIGVSLTGPDAGEFSITSQPAASVTGPSGSTSFGIQFKPVTSGRKMVVVRVASNDPDDNPFEFTIDVIAGFQAELYTPVRGARLTPVTTTFGWDSGATSQPLLYALGFGSTPGGYDRGLGYFASYSNSTTVTSPGDGEVVHVTLWSFINGVWYASRSTVTDYTLRQKARIISPANGSTLDRSSLALQWDDGQGVTNTALWVGTKAGGYDVYAGTEGAARARTVTVPTDAKIHVTLWSLIDGAWQASFYVFNAVPSAKASVTSPAEGAVLGDATLNLTWSSGIGVSRYAIWAGATSGAHDIAALDAGTATSCSLTVPRSGAPVYITLWSLINGVWQSTATWFTSAPPASGGSLPGLVSPANGSALSSSALDLVWSNGAGASRFALWAGSQPGGYELYAAAEGAGLSRRLTVPQDGRRIYVTLYSLVGGVWKSASYWFTAPTSLGAAVSAGDGSMAKAAMISPAAGSALTSSAPTFVWAPAAGATQYALWLGRSPGGYDLYAAFEGTNLVQPVSLPVGRSPVYATLWSLVGGVWQSNEYIYETTDGWSP